MSQDSETTEVEFSSSGAQPLSSMKRVLSGQDYDESEIESVAVRISLREPDADDSDSGNGNVSPTKIRGDTIKYRILWSIHEMDSEWATNNDITDYVGRFELSQNQVESATSTLEREDRLLERRGVGGYNGSGPRFEYKLNHAGRQRVEEVGEPA